MGLTSTVTFLRHPHRGLYVISSLVADALDTAGGQQVFPFPHFIKLEFEASGTQVEDQNTKRFVPPIRAATPQRSSAIGKGLLLILKAKPHEEQNSAKPTFFEVAERWYKVYKEDNPNLRPATKGDYRRILDHILYPVIGKRRIDEITTSDLQELLNRQSDIAISSQAKAVTTLRQIFEMAIQENYIVKNPAKIKLAKTGREKKDGRSLSQSEWIAVQNSLPSLCEPDRLFLALILYEGLRRGEALGLTWEDVDFEKNCIHIVRQAAYNNGSNTATIQPPKTKKSVRDVPLVKPLKDLLIGIEPQGEYIVGNSNIPYTKSMLTKSLRRIRKAIGITDLHPHMFRYSHATMLHELGVDDKTIQHWEGHASQATTTSFYIKQS